MKKALATILTLSILVATNPIANADFTDVSQEHFNYVSVNYLSDNNFADGYADGDFHPEDMIERAEALKIIMLSEGLTKSSGFAATGYVDVALTDWFAGYVVKATAEDIIQIPTDTKFSPTTHITRAEFIKMLLLANGFSPSTWANVQLFSDIPVNAWFASYMNYAGRSGILRKDKDGNLYPAQKMTRGEVAEAIYMSYLIENRRNNTVLLREGRKYMAQLEHNLTQNNLVTAKRAAEIFVSITQQTYRNSPTNKTSLGRAKLARAYDFLINGKIAKERNNETRGESWEQLAIQKAQEAKAVDAATQATATHIENLAD